MAFTIQVPSIPTIPSCDDFITAAPTGWWEPLQSSPLALQVVQTGDQVRFVSSGAGNGLSIAGLLGEPWRLDLGADFKIRGSFAVAFPNIPAGECGLNLAVSLGGSPVGGPWSGFVVDVGQSFGWNYRGVVVYFNGAPLQEAYEPLPPNGGIGTVYIRYAAATDTFSVGLSGYDGPQLFSYSGLRGLTGSQQAAVWLGAFAEGVVPSFGGQTAVIDQFCVDAGVVLVP